MRNNTVSAYRGFTGYLAMDADLSTRWVPGVAFWICSEKCAADNSGHKLADIGECDLLQSPAWSSCVLCCRPLGSETVDGQ